MKSVANRVSGAQGGKAWGRAPGPKSWRPFSIFTTTIKQISCSFRRPPKEPLALSFLCFHAILGPFLRFLPNLAPPPAHGWPPPLVVVYMRCATDSKLWIAEMHKGPTKCRALYHCIGVIVFHWLCFTSRGSNSVWQLHWSWA